MAQVVGLFSRKLDIGYIQGNFPREEERITCSKLVNAGDLNYLIQMGNSPKYHEMVEYCLGSFKSCKKIKRRYNRQQLLFMYAG